MFCEGYDESLVALWIMNNDPTQVRIPKTVYIPPAYSSRHRSSRKSSSEEDEDMEERKSLESRGPYKPASYHIQAEA